MQEMSKPSNQARERERERERENSNRIEADLVSKCLMSSSQRLSYPTMVDGNGNSQRNTTRCWFPRIRAACDGRPTTQQISQQLSLSLSLALLIDLISLLHTSIENGTRWEILASKCSYKREIELDALNNSNSNQFGSSRACVQMVNTTHLIRKEVCSNDRRQASLRRQAFNQRRSFTVFNAIELDQCH
jgi:hypothetical protein